MSLLLAACEKQAEPIADGYMISGKVEGLKGKELSVINLQEGRVIINANGDFRFYHPESAGESFNLVIEKQPVNPAQICTISGGAGRVNGGRLEKPVLINCGPMPKIATVADVVNNAMTSFAMNPQTGKFSLNGLVSTKSLPNDIAVHPQGKFVYTANSGDGSISAFVINQATGELYSGGTIETGQSPELLLVHPSGNFVYAVYPAINRVAVLKINQQTGMLGAPAFMSTEHYPLGIVFDYSGKHAFVSSSDYLSVFDVNPETGILSQVGKPVTAGLPVSLAISLDGKILYSVNRMSAAHVQVWGLDKDRGGLSSIFELNTKLYSGEHITLNKAGNFAYLTSKGSNTFQVVEIHSDGRPDGFREGTFPESINGKVLLHPDGKHAYTAHHRGMITVYDINQDDGTLSSRMSVRAGAAPSAMVVTPDGRFLYVLNTGSRTISMFEISQENGDLFPVGISNSQGLSVTAHPSGKFSYAANINRNSVTTYRMKAPGNGMTPIQTVDAGLNPVRVTLDAGGRFAYVPNVQSRDILVYKVDQETGKLNLAGAVQQDGAEPVSITLDAGGRHAYVANHGSDKVSVFAVDADTGMLAKSAPDMQTGRGPYAVILHPNGKLAYVVTQFTNLSDGIYAYAIDGKNGQLKQIATKNQHLYYVSFVGGGDETFAGGPRSLTLDAEGRYAYVTDWINGTLSIFHVDPANGLLVLDYRLAVAPNPQSSLLSPDGKLLYVMHQGSDEMSVFTVDSRTGRLAAYGKQMKNH